MGVPGGSPRHFISLPVHLISMGLGIELYEPESLMKKGMEHYRKYQFMEAFKAFDRITKLVPEFVEAWNNKGFVLMKMGELRWALDSFEQAVDLDSNYDVALLNLKRCRKLMLVDEREMATKDVSLRMTMVERAYKKGMKMFKKGKYRKAEKCFREVLRINPTDEEAYNNIGIALGRMGLYQDAVDFFHHALMLNPEYDTARANRKKYLRAMAFGVDAAS